jgi:hypothetical protein
MRLNRLVPLSKDLEKLARMVESVGDRCNDHQAFYDFLELSALAISNGVDRRHYDQRELRYHSIITKYKTLEQRRLFPEMLAQLVHALTVTECDVLGPIAAALGMTSFRKGQFWSPWEVCMAMARMTLATQNDGGLAETIRQQGFITALEPACGPGNMVLAFARAFQEAGFDLKTQLHFHAVDIAPWCVHMAYIQASLMGIPAVVMLGNSLAGEMQEHWYTPMHVFGGWSEKLSRVQRNQSQPSGSDEVMGSFQLTE